MADICAIKRGRPKLNRRSLGHKTCSYGLCKSSGKKISEDDNTYFIPFPKPCNAYKTEVINELLGKSMTKNSKHKTGNCVQCSTALRWITLCRRADFKRLTDITWNTYICSKHFMDQSGPTVQHPDPLPANIVGAALSAIRKRVRKPPTDRAAYIPLKKQKGTTRKMRHEPTDIVATLLSEEPILTDNTLDDARDVQPSTEKYMGGTKRRVLRANAMAPFDNITAERIEDPVPTITEDNTHTVVSIGTQTPEDQFIVPLSEDSRLSCCNVSKDASCNIASGKSNTEELNKFIASWISEWAVRYRDTTLIFVQIGKQPCKNTMEVHITILDNLYVCKVIVCGKPLQRGSAIHTLSKQINSLQALHQLLRELRDVKVCSGIVQASTCVNNWEFNDVTNSMHSVKCEQICRGNRCAPCTQSRKRWNENSRKNIKRQPTCKTKKCNNRFLSRTDLVSKVKEQQAKHRNILRREKRWKARCKEMISEFGVHVRKSTNRDLQISLSKLETHFEDGDFTGSLPIGINDIQTVV